MFKPAVKEVGFVKGSMFGPQGTGKTTLLAMLLMYLSKTYHNSAPVAWLASEKGVDFVIDFFKAEGVPLLVSRSRSFVDLKNAHEEALKQGCCGLGVDSTTHFWKDLYTEGMKARGPRIQRIGRIKEEWEPFARAFQDSPIHYLVTGRLGFTWEEYEIENEKGEIEKELSKGGTKMKAEADFGHEPDLEIECTSVEDPDFIKYEMVRGRARKTFKSQMLHAATMKKSRVWALNGQAFVWKDQPGYKLGYYANVASVFKPHFDTISIGQTHHVTDENRPSSQVLFQNGSDQSNYEHQIKKQVALEKWDATMELIAAGRKEENIRKRAIIGETITGTRSRTEIERLSLDELLHCVAVLMAVEARFKTDSPATDDTLRLLIGLAKDDVDHPGKNSTLLEVMLTQSVKNVEKVNGRAF